MKHYGLLPHDARIITTAFEYGTKKIATFDRDFERAREIVELLPKQYWGR
ncbi:PIN domain-containing protein [Palaeococcus ferrophilus]|nr:PIN domain-containing protein [Palaeococcus ferrophilus]